MYAVIESGGKQYRVAVGDRVKVESLRAEPGAEVNLDHVLMVADGDSLDVGSPYTGDSVAARVVQHGRGDKLRILKFRRRKNSRTHAGHRQSFTELEITGIAGKGAAGPATASAPEEAAGGDDLTQLSGVDAAVVEKLHQAGVTSLADIAAWSDEDIARIDEELDLEGRIQREDWVGQAQTLIK